MGLKEKVFIVLVAAQVGRVLLHIVISIYVTNFESALYPCGVNY
jgi:hypothetical protein